MLLQDFFWIFHNFLYGMLPPNCGLKHLHVLSIKPCLGWFYWENRLNCSHVLQLILFLGLWIEMLDQRKYDETTKSWYLHFPYPTMALDYDVPWTTSNSDRLSWFWAARLVTPKLFCYTLLPLGIPSRPPARELTPAPARDLDLLLFIYEPS